MSKENAKMYLSPKEAAHILRVHEKTIYRWCRGMNPLHATLTDGSWRIPQESVMWGNDVEHTFRMNQMPLPPKAGHVYLFRAENGLHKIGRSCDPRKRLKSLVMGLPVEFKIEFIHSRFFLDCWVIEQRLHKHFADKRVRGEWFDLSPEDVEWIKSYGS